MKTEEMLLGFDCRQSVAGVAANWDAKRREAFLFRTDAPQPLSTDTIVWPAVLDDELRPGACLYVYYPTVYGIWKIGYFTGEANMFMPIFLGVPLGIFLYGIIFGWIFNYFKKD